MKIHPTAIIEDGATLGEGVVVGPYATIGASVTLGRAVKVGSHVAIGGTTAIGDETVLHPGVVIGEPPQDLSFAGEDVSVQIGARCTLREHVTVNAGTARGRGRTVIGDDCFLMVGSHVGHDCVVGDHVVLSNHVLLAGHATLGDYVLIGGAAAIVQRVRIGAYAFISGLSGVTKDVIPYGYVIGHRGRLDKLNLVGLKRRGFSRQDISRLLAAYRVLFEEDGLFKERLDALREIAGDDPVVGRIVEFVEEGRGRPLLQPLPKSADVGATMDVEFLETGQ